MPERNNVTTISTTPEIVELLSQYKDDEDSWDQFFRKVLDLIEKDIQS